jgi:hypothetical protein
MTRRVGQSKGSPGGPGVSRSPQGRRVCRRPEQSMLSWCGTRYAAGFGVEPPVRWGPRCSASPLASRRIGDGVIGAVAADTERRSYGPVVPHARRSHQHQSSSGYLGGAPHRKSQYQPGG